MAISTGSFLVKSSASFCGVSILTLVLFWLIWVTRVDRPSICSLSKPLAANWANVLSVGVKAFSAAFSGLSLMTLMMLRSSAWRTGSNLAICSLVRDINCRRLRELTRGNTCSGESWAICVGGITVAISIGSLLLRMSANL